MKNVKIRHNLVTSALEFTDPPKRVTSRRRRSRYMPPEVQAALKAKPGEWARIYSGVPKNPQQAVYSWCQRNTGFETTSRIVGHDPDLGRMFDIYVRHVGPAAS